MYQKNTSQTWILAKIFSCVSFTPNKTVLPKIRRKKKTETKMCYENSLISISQT